MEPIPAKVVGASLAVNLFGMHERKDGHTQKNESTGNRHRHHGL